MQNRYTGDIGDYAKYSLLRTLGEGRKIGVAWYLFPDEGHNDDGKHVGYLNKPALWRARDSELFDFLNKIVRNSQRNVGTVEGAKILGEAIFTGHLAAGQFMPSAKRRVWRVNWFESVLHDLQSCDLIFADPDNGFCLDDKFSPGRWKDMKRIPITEALRLAKGRTAVIYHHNARNRGTHQEEIAFWLKELGEESRALRFRAGSSRTFFVINPTFHMHVKLEKFSEVWGDKAELY